MNIEMIGANYRALRDIKTADCSQPLRLNINIFWKTEYKSTELIKK